MNIEQLIVSARAAGASDVHLVCGLPVKFRVDGRLVDAGANGDAPLTHDDCERLAEELAGGDFDRIKRIGELDRADTIAGARVRINLFRQQGHVSAALRLLSDAIPPLETLGLPPAVMDFPNIQRGIVVVTGETGSGKSTTLAALIDAINHTRAENIITMEDPIEYVHRHEGCIVTQREIPSDVATYAEALRSAISTAPSPRATATPCAPCCARTPISSSSARCATWTPSRRRSPLPRRVTSCLPRCTRSRRRTPSTAWSTCSPKACRSRFACRYPPRSWRCCRSSCCREQVAGARELMMVTPAIRNLIREGKTPQIASSLATSAAAGSVTMDNALIALCRARSIDAQTAVGAAHDTDYVRKNVR